MSDVEKLLVKSIKEVDAFFEKAGGSTRHYVMERMIPILEVNKIKQAMAESDTSKETRTISIQVYRDSDGNPICAKNFETGAICKFLGSRRYGTIDVCMLGSNVDLFRYQTSEGESGFIKPDKNCMLWQGELG